MSVFLRKVAAALCAVMLPFYAAFPLAAETERVPSALTEWVKGALRISPELERAKAVLTAAQARYRAAGQPLYNPELALEAERTDIDTIAAGIDQTLDWSGKREQRSAVAEAELAAAGARLAETRLTLATRLLSALAAYRTADEAAALAQRRVELMQRFAELAERRQQAGDVNLVDLDLARLALSEARLQQSAAHTAVAEAEETLVALLGRPGPWPELPAKLPAPEAAGHQGVRSLPAIRAAEAEVLAARERVAVRRLERRPDPTVGLRAGKEDTESLIGLSLSIPLFVRNRYRAEVQAADADLTEAHQAARALVQRAEARREAARRRYRAAFDAWRQWQATGTAALGRQGELLERLWRAGEIGTADYLVQLRQSLDTQEAAAVHRGRAWRAWFQWLEATGRTLDWSGIEDDFEAN